MTLEQFNGEIIRRGYRTMTVGGRPVIVNPTNGQDMPFHEDVYRDLIAYHNDKVGSDALEMVLRVLEEGVERPSFAE